MNTPATTASPAVPRPASTTILLRAGQPFELFLIKRTPSQRFMGGTHVFPGGRMDEADVTVVRDALIRRSNADSLAARMQLTVEESLSYLVTAARELLEEAGVLLCRGASAEDARWVRSAMQDEQTFATALRARGLVVDGDSLGYLAHWVTPVVEPKRFSARFFVAALPDGQPTVIDEDEAVEGTWLTPKQALNAHLTQALMLPPPTVCVIEGLSRVPSLAEALAGSSGPVITIEPLLVDDQGTPTLVFPGDVLHPEKHGIPGAPTRVQLVNGVFVPARKERTA